MTPEQINITIAESLGWTIFHCNNKGEIKSWKSPNGSIWQEPWTPLRFAEDLNAMHEVEKTLSTQKFEAFWIKLASMYPEEARYCVSATALQRAEAYLHTIGKWNEKII